MPVIRRPTAGRLGRPTLPFSETVNVTACDDWVWQLAVQHAFFAREICIQPGPARAQRFHQLAWDRLERPGDPPYR